MTKIARARLALSRALDNQHAYRSEWPAEVEGITMPDLPEVKLARRNLTKLVGDVTIAAYKGKVAVAFGQSGFIQLEPNDPTGHLVYYTACSARGGSLTVEDAREEFMSVSEQCLKSTDVK